MERYAIICVLLHCYPGDCLSLEEMQKIVEGHIEAVPTALAQGWSQEPGVGLALIVNEEGKLQNLPVNQTATDLSAAYNDVIVGNAILLGTTDEDFIGLTERADSRPRAAAHKLRRRLLQLHTGGGAGWKAERADRPASRRLYRLHCLAEHGRVYLQVVLQRARGCGCGPDADQNVERPARSEQEEHRASG